MSLCIDVGWKKQVKYYKKVDCALSYITAIVLNVIEKRSYFGNWELKWGLNTNWSLKNFWENTYRSSTNIEQTVQQTNNQKTWYNKLPFWIAQKQAKLVENVNKLQKCVFKPCWMYTAFVILWWMDKAQRTSLLVPSPIVLEVFSIAVILSEAECIFLVTKYTISDD